MEDARGHSCQGPGLGCGSMRANRRRSRTFLVFVLAVVPFVSALVASLVVLIRPSAAGHISAEESCAFLVSGRCRHVIGRRSLRGLVHSAGGPSRLVRLSAESASAEAASVEDDEDKAVQDALHVIREVMGTPKEIVEPARPHDGQPLLDPQPLNLGVYVAITKIRLRSLPDIVSAPTGDTVKEGEVFLVTEIVETSGTDGLSYLKLGDRGWVFDRGVVGDWKGNSIVMRVAPDDQEVFLGILGNNETYAEYQEVLSHPDYKDRLEALLTQKTKEATKNKDNGDIVSTYAATVVEMAKNPEESKKMTEWQQWLMEPEKHPELQKRWLEEEKKREKYAEKISKIQEETDRIPGFDEMMEKAELDEALKRTPPSRVRPRWDALAPDEMTDMERIAQEEWQTKKRLMLAPPGGDAALMGKPRAWGRRMGFRVPIVNSPL